MEADNGMPIKKEQQSLHNQPYIQQNVIIVATLSPVLTSTQKYSSQASTKTSQDIINQIHDILDSTLPLKRKQSAKSIKTLDKKETNTIFKCNCKKTKCLKMYCECFALGKFCNGCNCCECQNLMQFEQARALAIDEALQRDPDIFHPSATVKKGGCICKKTECLKKYCECYSSGMPCTQQCKCQNCSNKA